jgi:hypothetical protein
MNYHAPQSTEQDYLAAEKKIDDKLAAKVPNDVKAAREKYGYGDVCKPLEMTQDGKSMCGSCKAVEGGTSRIMIHYFGCPCKKGGKHTRTKRRSKTRSKKARKTRRRI